MTEKNDTQRVDDLRKQLRALGYLDAGVDRFVLGPARSARSPWSIAALSSLRVGLLAALLLGPTVAAGIGARLPGLVTGPRDAIVVALYLAAMFGIAATVFTFAAAILVAALGGTAVATRARLVSRGAGTLVAIACLAYLTLWWRSANAEAWSAPVWTAFALLVAVVVSILVGHAVAITTFAVIAARHPAAAAVTPGRSATRLVVGAGAVAFAGAAGLLVLAAPQDVRGPEPPRLSVVSPGHHLVVIAIDGFDPDIFEALRRDPDGLLNLERIAARGQARVAVDDTRDPARAWTTIATGQPPEVHGVHSLETRRVAGIEGAVPSGDEAGIRRAIRGATDLLRLTRPSIASGAALRAKPFWEVAADAGLRVMVANWWATWPAEATGPTAPVILSDRATLRLEHGGTLDAEIAPKELYERLRAAWPSLKQRSAELVRELIPPSDDPAIAAVIRRSAELDALQLGMVSELIGVTGAESPDVLVLYLPGLDIAQHTLFGSTDSASAMAARLEAVRGYYVFLDRLVGGLLRDDAHLFPVLLTQPGRLASKSRGVLAFDSGGAVESIATELRPVDVAPTLLYALGVPISRELAGRPQTQLFTQEFQAKYPVREVPTYGPRRPPSAVREGQPLDEEMVERLRSLGYVR